MRFRDHSPRRDLPIVTCAVLAFLGTPGRADTCHSLTLDADSLEMDSGISALCTVDLDLDGDDDVLVASAVGGFLRVLVNRGASVLTVTTIAVSDGPSALAIGDPDGDGDPDVLVGGTSGFRLLVNDGAGNLAVGSPIPFFPGDSSATAATFSDANGDGIVDALLALSHHPVGASWSGGLVVALGNGSGVFTKLPTHTLPVPADRAVFFDFDGDSRVDVAELGGYATSSSVAFALAVGGGAFVNSSTTLPAGLYASGFAAADIDQDGDLDLAAGGKYTTYVYRNDGLGGFSLHQNYFAGNYVKGIAFGDVDLDGDADMLVTSGSSSSIRIAWNDGNGHFTSGPVAPATVQTLSVALADIDQDGYLDPFAGDYTTGRLSFARTHCSVATYGSGKTNSAGCVPTLVPTGTPSISGSGFQFTATALIPGQPAWILVGGEAQSLPALGGDLLVAPPFVIVPAITQGTFPVTPCSGILSVAATGSMLAPAGIGTRIFVQVLSADPYLADGTGASLSDGLSLEVLP